MTAPPHALEIQIWPIDRLIFYARNPRKNDAAVDRMCASIREFGFKIPVLARSDGEVVDGHLRLKAARKLESWPGGDTSQIPVILCDEWTPQQVKAFRLMVNRSVAWAEWDEELLSLELQELNAADFDLDLTGFSPVKSTPCSPFPTRSAPTRHRRFPGIPSPVPATCGCAGNIECSAATPSARRMSPACSASASRS